MPEPLPPGALDAAVPLLPVDPLGPAALPVVLTPPAPEPILLNSIWPCAFLQWVAGETLAAS